MRVNICKEVEIEAVVEVDFREMLTEFGNAIESGEDGPRRLLWALDHLTRVLTIVKDGWIEKMTPDARTELAKRLAAQAERYRQKGQDDET